MPEAMVISNNLRRENPFLIEVGTASTADSSQSYKKILANIIKRIESDRKPNGAKKEISKFCTQLKKIEDEERNVIIEELKILLLNLPYMLLSKWEIISALFSAKLLKFEPEFPYFLYNELLACSEDQVNSSKCSSFIVSLACDPDFSENLASVIFKTLINPSSSTRSNVARYWLSRVLSFKSATKLMENLLEKCQKELEKTENIESENIEKPCIVLTDYSHAELEPKNSNFLAFDAFFNLLLLLNSSRSQVRIEINNKNEIICKGLKHPDLEIRKFAYKICQNLDFYPEFLETDFEKNEEKIENHSRFYPIREEENMDFKIELSNFEKAEEGLENLLEIQANSKYPSVSEVMNNLRNQKIDERAFVAEITKILDFVEKKHKNDEISNGEMANFVFTMISRCPLRAVVDYAGEILKKICGKNENFRDLIFEKTSILLEKEEENSRPLVFELCLIATCQNNCSHFSNIWNFLKIKNMKKLIKMQEMLANVVGNKSAKIENGILKEMMRFSLEAESAQLFAASVTRYLDIQSENERILLASHLEGLSENINMILHKNPGDFSKKQIQLILHLFGCFVYGSSEFYTIDQMKMASKMKNLIIFMIKKYAADGMIVYACINSILGFLPWEDVRRKNDFDIKEKKKPKIEELIWKNRRRCVFWEKYDDAERILSDL